MPRGQRSDGKYNFHVKRHICPNCKKKGLHLANDHWYCMYRCEGGIYKFYDKSVREQNPLIEQLINNR